MASKNNNNDTINTTTSNTANLWQPLAIATPTHRNIPMSWYLPVAVGTCLLPCMMMMLMAKSMIQRMDKKNNLEQQQLEDVEVRSVAPTVTSDDDDDDLDIEVNNIEGQESTDVS